MLKEHSDIKGFLCKKVWHGCPSEEWLVWSEEGSKVKTLCQPGQWGKIHKTKQHSSFPINRTSYILSKSGSGLEFNSIFPSFTLKVLIPKCRMYLCKRTHLRLSHWPISNVKQSESHHVVNWLSSCFAWLVDLCCRICNSHNTFCK